MNAGTLLKIFRDVVVLLEVKGVISPDGSFDTSKLDTLQEDLDFVAAVEALLKSHGLDVPNRVDKIIQLIPLLISL